MLHAYQTSRAFIGRPVIHRFPWATNVLPKACLDQLAATGLVVAGVLIASLAHAADVPCEHLPYLVELDNYGSSRMPGKAGAGGIWVWGYDEITWFAHQDKSYRAAWLKYAWDWVRKTDPNAYLQMPGSRTCTSRDIRWYFANNPGPACPNGFGDEEAIRAVWTAASARPGTSPSTPYTARWAPHGVFQTKAGLKK
jgi:hypothetical protein